MGQHMAPRESRGLARPSQRFEGDASAYGSTELRLRLGNFLFMLPGGFGGGVWFSFLDTRSAVSLSMVASEERNAFYMGVGFGF